MGVLWGQRHTQGSVVTPFLLRVALEGRGLPVVHGCGWDSGAARERSSALAASVASRYALGAEGGGAARPGAYMCPPRNCALRTLSPGGSGDVEEVVCCALLERLGARRASSSCRGGEGEVAHRENLAATASATLERSTGTMAHGKRAARERRRRRSKVSRGGIAQHAAHLKEAASGNRLEHAQRGCVQQGEDRVHALRAAKRCLEVFAAACPCCCYVPRAVGIGALPSSQRHWRPGRRVRF